MDSEGALNLLMTIWSYVPKEVREKAITDCIANREKVCTPGPNLARELQILFGIPDS